MPQTSGVPIVVNNPSPDDTDRATNLLSFFSYLQKKYNVESVLAKDGKKLPETAFNIMDNLWIMNIAFKSTLFAEFLIFLFFLFPIYVLIKSGVWQPIPFIKPEFYSSTLYVINFVGLIISTLIYFYISKYYIPESVIVKGAIITLYAGRAIALVLKAVIFFLVVSMAGSLFYEPEFAKQISNILAYILDIDYGFDLKSPVFAVGLFILVIVSATVVFIEKKVAPFIFSIMLLGLYIAIILFNNKTPEEIYQLIFATRDTVYHEMFVIPSIFLLAAFLSYAPVLYREAKHKINKSFKYTKDVFKKDKTHIGWGYELDFDKPLEIKPIYITEKARNVHTAVAGNTGTGKTRMMEYLVEQDIRKGHAVLVIEPKGDKDFLARVIQVAKEEGKLNNVIYISLIYPEVSEEFGPLAHYFVPEEIVSNVMAMLDSSQKFFSDTQKAAILLIVSALRFLSIHKPDFVFTFEVLAQYATHQGISRLREMLERELDMFKGEARKEAESLYKKLKQVEEEQEPKFFAEITAGLKVVLDILTTESVGKIIGKATKNRFVEMIEKGKAPILIVQTQSLMIDDSSRLVAKVIMNTVKNLAGRFNAKGEKFKVPLKVHIDEAARAMPPEIEDLLAMGRSVGIHLTFYFQSINQFYQELGQDKAKSALDLIANFIIFRVQRSTAEYFAKMIGETDKKPNLIIGSENNFMVTFQRGYLVEPERLTNLPDRTAIVYLKPEHQDIWYVHRNTYFVRVPEIEDTYVKIKLPDVNVVKN